MTFKQKIVELLIERGLFDDWALEVFELVKKAPENEAMLNHWDDDISDYPKIMINIAWISTRRHALTWIDANKPQAWFRSMFDLNDDLNIFT